MKDSFMFDANNDLNKEAIKKQFIAVAKNSPRVYLSDHDSILWDNPVVFNQQGEPIELTTDNVKVTRIRVKRNAAHMKPTKGRTEMDQQIVIGVQPRYWNVKTGLEEKICTLSHEFQHIFYPNHKPEFWTSQTRALHHLYFRQDMLKPSFATEQRSKSEISFDWNKVWYRLLGSITERSVDNRMENVDKRAEKTRQYIEENTPFTFNNS